MIKPGKISEHRKSLTKDTTDEHQATDEEYETAKEARLHTRMPQLPMTLEEEAQRLPQRKHREYR
jgi:hypothetical protein